MTDRNRADDKPKNRTVKKMAQCSLLILAVAIAVSPRLAADISPEVLTDVQRKVVKIFGAGGLNRIKGYGTGFVVSPEGDIATVWSPVLDTPLVDIVFWDGSRRQGKLAGVDSRRDLAVIRLVSEPADPVSPRKFAYFDLERDTANAQAGSRVFAVSNVFGVAVGDEPLSVMRGATAAQSELEARRGTSEIAFDGPVYLLDLITNNSGAAGGVVISPGGKLIGVIGKELKNSRSNTWVNYAMPVESWIPSLRKLLKPGEEGMESLLSESPKKTVADPVDTRELGVILVPQIVVRTPAYLEAVLPETPAARAGLKPDDLILFLNDRIVGSCREWEELLSACSKADRLRIVVRRSGRLHTCELEFPVATP